MTTERSALFFAEEVAISNSLHCNAVVCRDKPAVIPNDEEAESQRTHPKTLQVMMKQAR
jgi:hypothetical protein